MSSWHRLSASTAVDPKRSDATGSFGVAKMPTLRHVPPTDWIVSQRVV